MHDEIVYIAHITFLKIPFSLNILFSLNLLTLYIYTVFKTLITKAFH